MLLALEGISAVGKSSVARILSERLILPVYSDSVRHGLLGSLVRRELYLTGNAVNAALADISRLFDLILDRWCLSSYVYDVWRDPGFEPNYSGILLPRYVKAEALVYLLRIDVALADRRLTDRAVGPYYTRSELAELDELFCKAAVEWVRLGGHVLEVDATDPAEAARRIEADFLERG